MRTEKHTFVICAYKESAFLEECVKSLVKQTIQSKMLMVTSTPNAHIAHIAEKYGIPLFINEGMGGITQDWNFGYKCAETEYVTIAHQDDIYRKDYLERALRMIESCRNPLLFFSNYYEIRMGDIVKDNTLLRIKRLMLLPLRVKVFQKSRFIRRRILSFGSPICCPSVLYVKPNLPEVIFRDGFRSCEDWEAWEMLSRKKGAFLYDHKALMCHRIHADSETSAIIGDNARSAEEFIMYCKFWPVWIAKLLNRQYAKGQRSNNINL
ncbi:glycosyltransferase [Anaerotruncus sp. 1XD22-93]|nr:glycosyltransferase [Lachnospiraceae bacterium]NBI74120.1 glycosyltransferase [Lachnospiraceae bacterium]RKK00172.1 glycosyltransferase [Anaerotruncus sp. 1XD22-93]